MHPSRLLTLRDAAEVFGLPAKSLRLAVQRRELPAYRLTPAANCPIRVRLRDVECWLEASCRRQHAPPPRCREVVAYERNRPTGA